MHKFRSLLVIGVLLLASSMAQECPPPGEGFGLCEEACNSNSNCSDGQLCCSNGCGHRCMTPVEDPCATVRCAAPNCSDVAAGTVTLEGQCCPVCACAATDGTMVAAGTSFMNDCNTCFCGSTGIAGCTLIACASPPTTEPTTATTDANTLPTSSPTVMCPNATNVSGTCDERCSNDDHCTNGQLCCSNGCGHSCMDPVMNCTAVSCLRPNCQSPSVLFTPERSCCPICGCPTSNGDTVAPGETYHPDSCNTCICGQNGLSVCTLAFCPPPTDSTPTTNQTTATPTVGPTDSDCPVEGQVRIPCASPCSVTCANMDTVLICPTVCVTNGCQCVNGTVIDEQSNTCVTHSECPTAPPPQPSGCTASDGTSVDAGETYMDQCNTCICLEGGIGACTRIACRGCTLANGSWIGVGETYMKDCNTCTCTDQDVDVCTEIDCSTDQDCPVGGQIRVECASPCNTTCANMNTLLACPAVCVINGCQCPSGMVIDEQNNTCVVPAACPTTEAPPTNSTPTTGQSTGTPSTDPTEPTACPFGGQTRVECASQPECSTTCANMNMVSICPLVCVVNGCECPIGTVIDEQSNNCVAPSDCPTGRTQTCPTVQSTNEENCVNECSSDDDCQYDRICCSNGCGGHTCSDSVEMCQLIECDRPVCEDGAQPEYSSFSCCPFCPTTPPPRPSGCTASDGKSVDVGETYMDQCNSCRCLEGGVGKCTEKFCLGCTLADGTWLDYGETYKNDCMTCRCADYDLDVCTYNMAACVKPGDQDALDGTAGSGTTLFAGVITTLLCGLLSIFL